MVKRASLKIGEVMTSPEFVAGFTIGLVIGFFLLLIYKVLFE